MAALVAHGLSERHACQAVGLHRSTYRYQPQTGSARHEQAAQLRAEVIRLAHQHRRFG